MIVSKRFIDNLIQYINNIKSDLENIESDTFDMDRAERLRNLSFGLYNVIHALHQIN